MQILESPLVTIIAACYNHERFAEDCLEGIRNQSYPSIQLIITDDCSTDQSVKIIDDWIFSHGISCTFIKHDVNKGLPKTLNEALRVAQGKYVSLISTDDVWLSEFINNHVRIFEEENNSVGVLYGRAYTIDENGNQLQLIKPAISEPPEGDVLFDLLNSCFITAPTAMIRKSCFNRVGFYDEELDIEDYDMWLRVAQYYRFKFCPDILTNYRILLSSFTNAHSNELDISVAKIFIKQLAKYGNHEQYKKLIDNKLIAYRRTLYKIGNPLATKYLLLGIKRKFNKSDLFMYICSLLRVPYHYYKNISSWKNSYLQHNI